ncbi:MAG TPA: hypothetical protein VGI92_12685 [Gemmatimonadales bacterium]|jgi:hypothetical protein
MNPVDPQIDYSLEMRRFVLGIAILVVSVLLSNVFDFLVHPEQVFDVGPNSPLVNQLHLVGFCGQLVFGGWIGLAILFDLRRGLRVWIALWFASLALFFVPLPRVAQEPWLAPAELLGLVMIVWLSHALDAAFFRRSE